MNGIVRRTLDSVATNAMMFVVLCLSCGCASRVPTRGFLPATYRVEKAEGVDVISTRFYGKYSQLTVHCIWYCNPNIRNLGFIPAGREIVIPVIPDQTLPMATGEVAHVYGANAIADPPYGFDTVVAEDGSIQIFLGIRVRVEGLTPREAAVAIKKAIGPDSGFYEPAVIRFPRTQPPTR